MATYKQIPQYFGNDTIPYAYKCSKHGIYSDGFYCSGCEEEWQVEERIRKSQEQARQREQHEQEAVLKKRQEAEAAERNRRLEAEVAAHKRKLDAEVAETKKRLEIEKASVASGATPESLTARAQYFLEYYEWENADRALETVLNIDPHYAPAFIGKLCIYLKINKKENLVHHHVPLEDIRYFKDAMRFADEELRNELAGINQTIKDRVRKAEEEARKRKVAEERKHKIAEEEHRKKQERIKLMELLLRL
ncbi:MAG: hypothetical protein FWC95_03310, partial [Defluviitaleaceae bacterium]|nr:hypothetical protein [Defluviitaleaceae bacterium]